MSEMWTKSAIDPLTGMPSIRNENLTVQQVYEKGTVLRTYANLNITLDEDTLKASEFFTFDALDSSLNGSMSAAHGHYDAVKDEFINYRYTIGPDKLAEYFVFSVKPNGNAEILRVATFKDILIYMRSCATTENMSSCVCGLLS